MLPFTYQTICSYDFSLSIVTFSRRYSLPEMLHVSNPLVQVPDTQVQVQVPNPQVQVPETQVQIHVPDPQVQVLNFLSGTVTTNKPR